MKTPLLVAVALFFLLAISGCVPIIKQFSPSLEHCDEVSYHRKGNTFTVLANCRV